MEPTWQDWVTAHPVFVLILVFGFMTIVWQRSGG